MFGRVSTAIAVMGRSSDRLSDLSVRRWCFSPNPWMPRSTMLAAMSFLLYRSTRALATNVPLARWRSPK